MFALLAGLISATLSAQLSSRYVFVAGHGQVSWPHTYDHNNYVARDWNRDGRHDVLSLTSAYSWNRDHSQVPLVQPHVFLSNADGSYTHSWVSGVPIRALTTEWYGDYFSKRKIIVGHGNPFIDEVLQPLNCTGLACVPFGPRAAMHHAITDDIDKDGKLDLITFKAGTSIFSNFQPGAWGNHPGNGKPQNLGVWSGNTGAFTGTFIDLDGDGYPEMITGSYKHVSNHQLHGPGGGGAVPNGGITVWKNHRGRNFTVMQKLPGGPGPFGGRLMLKNGNDLILYGECGDDCAQNSYIKVYSRAGGKLHLKQVFNVGAVVGTYSKGHPPRLLDINGDGHKDLFVNHYNNYGGAVGTQHGGIWLNNGNGTFTRLKTPIFARIPKAHLKGMLAPVHANGDGRLDWIVIYQDGTFGTLLASGGGSVASAASGSGVAATNFAGYVEAYRDLSVAYSAGSSQNKANWGKSHYCTYGLREGRTYPGLSAANCLTSISNSAGKVNSTGDSGDGPVEERAMRFLPLVNWQLGFVGAEINQLADTLTNNNDLLSFNQIQMTDLLSLNLDSAITCLLYTSDAADE